MSENFIPYSCQFISEEDIKEVERVLRSDFLTQGPEVEKFETALKSKTGAKHVVAVSSGTAALHLAIAGLELNSSSLVWTSPITFVASANCARYVGAQVDFVDIEPETGNMSVSSLKVRLEQAKKNNSLPDVIIPVHFSGLSCDMEAIHQLSSEYSFKVIEDASHAIGGKYDNSENIGSSSKSYATIFSFHAVKAIATGEGGAIATADGELAEKLIMLRTHGITRDSSKLSNKGQPAHYYEQQLLGFNYRLTDIQAALGRSQLSRLDSFIERRFELAKRYDHALKESRFILPKISEISAWHLYPIQVPGGAETRDQLFSKLREQGIGANVHYQAVHLQPFYNLKRGSFPMAEKFADGILSIPLHPRLTESEQDKVIKILLDS